MSGIHFCSSLYNTLSAQIPPTAAFSEQQISIIYNFLIARERGLMSHDQKLH